MTDNFSIQVPFSKKTLPLPLLLKSPRKKLGYLPDLGHVTSLCSQPFLYCSATLPTASLLAYCLLVKQPIFLYTDSQFFSAIYLVSWFSISNSIRICNLAYLQLQRSRAAVAVSLLFTKTSHHISSRRPMSHLLCSSSVCIFFMIKNNNVGMYITYPQNIFLLFWSNCCCWGSAYFAVSCCPLVCFSLFLMLCVCLVKYRPSHRRRSCNSRLCKKHLVLHLHYFFLSIFHLARPRLFWSMVSSC